MLFILHCSPPVHGASKVGDSILNSTIINENLETRFIKIKASVDLQAIGKFSLNKVKHSLLLFFRVLFLLLFFRPGAIYYTTSPKGFAFYRDLMISIPIKFFRLFIKYNIFYHYHSRGIKEFTSNSSLSKKLTNVFLSGVNAIFISPSMESELNNVKSYKKIHFLNNGVEDNIDATGFNEILKHRSESDTINVLYLSNMIKEKGYDTALELAKTVRDLNVKNIKFHFAGGWASKADTDYFNNFVSMNKLQDLVQYHGMVQGDQKRKLFASAKVFLFPSRYKKEIFPLSLLEALSYGLPIIAFDVGAVKNIVNDEVGKLSNKENLLKSFNLIKEKYLNEIAYKKCRDTYLDKYTSQKFETNLLNILKS